MVQQKIVAFREFASQLAAQVVEQMCTEYEREMSQIWNDCVMYRNELDRVAQLLGSQLEREKKLHGVIEQMEGHSRNVHQQAQYMAQQSPGSQQLHQFLEQIMGQHSELLNQTVAGVGQANQVLSAHAASATQMKQESISTEHEFVRIVELLQRPMVASTLPAPTMAVVPGSVKFNPGMSPGNSFYNSPPVQMPMPGTPRGSPGGLGGMPGQSTPGPPSPGGFAQRSPYGAINGGIGAGGMNPARQPPMFQGGGGLPTTAPMYR